ncbi:TlpA disulfide reductase family protein [Terriglobus aquaticus]|uniref:TlpA disulfide reductase family protein n=1 Tax=Terriglobus aquaticus TaxID=940139 RepID=A0ABW9KHE5_9BACT|nr:TlpA disulfide reductase family protein [Terriglobus aquaticus]
MPSSLVRLGSALLLLPALLYAAPQPKTARHWTGTATYRGQSIPVQLNLAEPGPGGSISGSLQNGNEQSPSSNGLLQDGHLTLQFDYFARKLQGTLTPTGFEGQYTGARMKAPIPVVLHPDQDGKPATRFVAATAPVTINGDWEIAVHSSKGESAWTLHVQPFGGNGEVQATIQRIDGDTGGLYGGLDLGSGDYRVSRFAANGPTLYALHPAADGTLQVKNLLSEDAPWTARRVADARRENLAPPTRSTEQTSVVDPNEPLHFSGVDLSGQPVSSNDPLFRGKVVIAAVGGSWCPNCHDEAPLLVDLYNRFHSRGLEVVDLSFEEEDQLHNPERLRAFVARYRVPYTVLLVGTPDQLNQKLPQGKNLNSWPTSFFIGRDGLVKQVHAGFSGPATGAAYTELREETIALIERLLAQSGPPQATGTE